MRRAVLLGVLWTAAIAGLVSASAMIDCKDGNTCNKLRVIAQLPEEVDDVPLKYPRARDVDFHGNLLEGFSYPHAVKWQNLNLSYNLLTQDIFQNIWNDQLKVIDITYNKLRTVSIPLSVTDFIAERNLLHDIIIGSQSRLQRLILPKNKFDSLKRFAKLPHLNELDLSCNDLSEVMVDQLPASIRTLKLARNHIHTVGGSSSLQSLQYLDLSHNILTTVLDSHVIFPRVEYLYLQNNKIVMWMNEPQISNQFQEVNLLDNDWDCKSLKAVVSKMKRKTIQGPRSSNPNCTQETYYICCTTADSPYADRLIKYRKQEYRALQEGTAQRLNGNISCSSYDPNPCDGDENLVYQVAKAGASNATSLANSTLRELEQKLRQEKNVVEKLSKNVTSLHEDNNVLSKEHADLVAYINQQYSQVLPAAEQKLNGAKDSEVEKIQDLFGYFNIENENLKKLINAEERKNQDKLNEVETLEKEIEDLNYQKDRMTEEVTRRNETVNAYKARIAALNQKLG